MAAGIFNHGRVTCDELWTNPNPTASFSAGDEWISFGGNQYDALLIFYNVWTSDSTVRLSSKIFLPSLTAAVWAELCGYPIGSTSPKSRWFKIAQYGLGVYFNSGVSGTGVDDNACIPYKIYGLLATE